MIGGMVLANLVFYEGWLDALINLSKISGDDFAKDAAWEILNYGIKGEYSTTDENLIGFIDGLCYAQIKKSQNRYEACRKNGEQGGAPAQYDHNEMIELYKQGMNINQISKNVNCSYNAVRNVINKYKAITNRDDEI